MSTYAKDPFTLSINVDSNVGASVEALVSVAQFTPSISLTTSKKIQISSGLI